MILSLIIAFILIGVSAALFYVYLVWNFDYWKKRGVNGPKPLPFFGNFPNNILLTRSLGYELQDIYRKFRDHEDFVGVYNLRTPELLVLSPELVHKVFVTNYKNFEENELSSWLNIGSDVIFGYSAFTLGGEAWKNSRHDISGGITVSKISLRLTTELVTGCVLDVKTNSLSENPEKVLGNASVLADQTTIFKIYWVLVGLFPFIKNIYKVKIYPKSMEDFFVNLMGSAFKLRRTQKSDRSDLLQYILDVKAKRGLTDKQLYSHTMSFLVDGYDTSSTLMAVTLYQLAKYPEEQKKLRNEIVNNLNDKGEVEFDKLHAMPFLDSCVNEAMRILPPVTFMKKICTEAIELTNKNGTKVKLEKGTRVLLPMLAIFHDEEYYPNPEEFLPERFNPENGGAKKYRDMGLFTPYGDGPRICVGIKFGYTQVKLAICSIIKNFNLKLNPRTRRDNYIHPTKFVAMLEGGIWIDYEERT